MKRKLLIISALLLCFVAKAADEKTAYEKIFDKKENVKTVEGLMKLHKIDDKIIAEIPLTLFEKSFKISSVVEQTSNYQAAYLGQQVGLEQRLEFTRTDSLLNVRQARRARPITQDKDINSAFDHSYQNPIFFSFPIKTFSPDSTAIVADITSLFTSEDLRFSQVYSSAGRVARYNKIKSEFSYLEDILGYKDRIEVLSTKTYESDIPTKIIGADAGNTTVKVRTVLSLLPEDTMPIRIADTRVGTAKVSVNEFDINIGSKPVYYATRWRLDNRTEPITFYIDTLFTPTWQRAIKDGVEAWNDAFEAIGYPNLLKAELFTKDSSELQTNRIEFIQIADRSMSATKSIDTRTGEILSASIAVFNDLEHSVLQPNAMIYMGAYNPAVRSKNLPEKELYDIVKAYTMREMGVCLGLSYNYAAAAAYSIDQLRDPEFTAQHGFASSVMTKLDYNPLIQKEDYDRGAVPVMRNLGPYDYYAIKWLYAPESCEIRNEAEYIYMPRSIYDPRYADYAIGNDPIKLIELSYNNLKYVFQNADKWLKNDSIYEDNMLLMPDFIWLAAWNMSYPLKMTFGGLYMSNPLSSTDYTYQAIPIETQKQNLQFYLDNLLDCSWIDNEGLCKISGINLNMSNKLELQNVSDLMGQLSSPKIFLNGPYTQNAHEQLYEYLCDYICDMLARNKNLSFAQLLLTEVFYSRLRTSIIVKPQVDSRGNYVAIASAELYDPAQGFLYHGSHTTTGFYYDLLTKLQRATSKAAKSNRNQEQSDILSKISFDISKLINGK